MKTIEGRPACNLGNLLFQPVMGSSLNKWAWRMTVYACWAQKTLYHSVVMSASLYVFSVLRISSLYRRAID